VETIFITIRKMTQLIYPLLAFFSILVIPGIVGYALLPKTVEKALQWLFGFFIIGIFFLSAYVGMIPQLLVKNIGVGIFLLCVGKSVIQVVQEHKHGIRLFAVSLPSLIIYGSICLFLLYAFADIYANPIQGQDGIVIWLGKAKGFYYWNPLTAISFVRYPGLGSMLWAVVMMVFGLHESYGRFIYPVAYSMFFITLWSSINVKKYALSYALCLAVLLFFFFRPSLYSGYQDDFLSLTGGLSVALFILYTFDMKKSYRYMLGCFFGGSLGLIKNEGVLLGLIVFVVFLLLHFKTMRKEWKEKSFFYIKGILLFFIVLGFWTVAISLYGLDSRNIQGDQITLQGIFEGYKNFNRIPIIGTYFYAYFLQNPLFIFIFLGSIITAIVRPLYRRTIIYILLIIFFHSMSIIWVYFATTAPLVWHLETSLFRLMDQHMSLYILLAVSCIQLFLSTKKSSHISL